jgi:hypothetical protein
VRDPAPRAHGAADEHLVGPARGSASSGPSGSWRHTRAGSGRERGEQKAVGIGFKAAVSAS